MTVRRFFVDLVGAYADGVRSMIALPLLFALLVGFEFIQHVAEVRIGFFNSAAAAHSFSNDSSRMTLGWLKMTSVYVGGFFVIRYLVRSREGKPVASIRPAAQRYLPYVVYSLCLFALIFYGPLLAPRWNDSSIRATVALIQIALEPLLILWIVSAATDGRIGGPVQSATASWPWYIWGLMLFFVGRLPVNALHQLLNQAAMGSRGAVLWTLLGADAICVGLIISVVPALYVRIARFIGERRTGKRLTIPAGISLQEAASDDTVAP